jgi:hypothetical protein
MLSQICFGIYCIRKQNEMGMFLCQRLGLWPKTEQHLAWSIMHLSARWIMQYDATTLLHQHHVNKCNKAFEEINISFETYTSTHDWRHLSYMKQFCDTQQCIIASTKNSTMLVGLMYDSDCTAALERSEHHLKRERPCATNYASRRLIREHWLVIIATNIKKQLELGWNQCTSTRRRSDRFIDAD